jgi:vesicular inhibitory amino acid transporter
MPLRLLSLPSILSTISSFVLIAIILIDGLGKDTAPGSLLHPAETNIFPQWRHYNFLGGIGFVLAGFGGHAVVPSLARDMKTPENFDRVSRIWLRGIVTPG